MELNQQRNLFLWLPEKIQEAPSEIYKLKVSSEKIYFKGTLLEGLNEENLEERGIFNIRTILSQTIKQFSSPKARTVFIKAIKTEILLKQSCSFKRIIQRNFLLDTYKIL